MAFAHGVELDAHVFGAWHLQDAQMLVAEDEAVWVVVHHENVVAAGKVNESFVS